MDAAHPAPPPNAPADAVSRVAVPADLDAIEHLHDRVFGPGALTRAAYRVREDQPPLSPFCRVLWSGQTLLSAIRMTPVRIGGRDGALLLGPLMVAPEFANRGHGRRLVGEALAEARQQGVPLVVLVGDLPYYERFGFRPSTPGRLVMPGPVDPRRLLVAELEPGSASRFSGRISGH